MNPNILTTEDLKAATGYERQGDIERCLQKNHIRYFHGKGGVWTTPTLVNAAGGIVPNQAIEEQELL